MIKRAVDGKVALAAAEADKDAKIRAAVDAKAFAQRVYEAAEAADKAVTRAVQVAGPHSPYTIEVQRSAKAARRDVTATLAAALAAARTAAEADNRTAMIR